MFSETAKSKFINTNGPRLEYFKKENIEKLHSIIHSKFGEFTYKTTPRDYQYRALYASIVSKRCLLFLGPRLGKTKISLDFISNIKSKNKPRFLVIVPSDSIISVWEDETKTHSNLKALGVYGTTNQRIELLSTAHMYDLVIMPFSGVQAIFSKKVVGSTKKNRRIPDKEKIDTFKDLFDGIIIDEIHHCKASTTLRFKILRMLIKDKEYRLGLTGTPFGRDPFSLWSQFYLIDEGSTFSQNEMFFRDAFGKMDNSSMFPKLVFDDKKIGLLSRKSSTRSLSYSTYEGLGINVFPSNTIHLKMTPHQEAEYNKAIATKDGEISNIYIKLRQISSGYVNWTNPETGESSSISVCRDTNPKLEWLESELFDTDDRIVIYYEFTQSGQAISDLLKKMNIKHRWIHGANKNKVKDIRDYKEGKVNIIIFQSLTGAEGLDLWNTNRQIFFETTDKVITYQQISYRAVSTKRTCPLIVDNLTTSPVERKILDCIKEGKSMLNEIIFNPNILKERA